MGIVALGEQAHDSGTLLRSLEQEESESHDGGSADVVIDIADCHVEELADGLVGAGAAVGHGNGVHARAAQNGVLVVAERF